MDMRLPWPSRSRDLAPLDNLMSYTIFRILSRNRVVKMLVDSFHVTSFIEGYQKPRRVRCRSAGIQTLESEHRGQAMFHAIDRSKGDH